MVYFTDESMAGKDLVSLVQGGLVEGLKMLASHDDHGGSEFLDSRFNYDRESSMGGELCTMYQKCSGLYRYMLEHQAETPGGPLGPSGEQTSLLTDRCS